MSGTGKATLVKDRFELPVTVGSQQSVAGALYRQREEE
jgi:hypothetical protein